jgi:hypothetical protein
MIAATADMMYSLAKENRFQEVTYTNGDTDILYATDFASGARDRVYRAPGQEAGPHAIKGEAAVDEPRQEQAQEIRSRRVTCQAGAASGRARPSPGSPP